MARRTEKKPRTDFFSLSVDSRDVLQLSFFMQLVLLQASHAFAVRAPLLSKSKDFSYFENSEYLTPMRPYSDGSIFKLGFVLCGT